MQRCSLNHFAKTKYIYLQYSLSIQLIMKKISYRSTILCPNKKNESDQILSKMNRSAPSGHTYLFFCQLTGTFLDINVSFPAHYVAVSWTNTLQEVIQNVGKSTGKLHWLMDW